MGIDYSAEEGKIRLPKQFCFRKKGAVTMESITERLGGAILRSVPRLDLSPIGGKSHGKLKLGPEQLLSAIHGRALAVWALTISLRFT